MTMVKETRIPLADAMKIALDHALNGRSAEALAAYEAIAAVAPDDVNVLTNLGTLRCQMGDPARGIPALEYAHTLAPGDGAVRGNLVAAYRAALQTWNGLASRDEMIAYSRKLLRLQPGEEAFRGNLESLLAYGELPAVLADYEPHRPPESIGRTILIACFPKSGSSWLVNAVQSLSGFASAQYGNAFVENEQELYLPAIRYWFGRDKVVQQHCRASAPNVHLIQAFGMQPVVLIRNLLDTLVSMRDFWDAGAVRNSYLYPDWNGLDQETKHDALVRHLAPWYVQFFVSWVLAERKGDVAPLWVRYEEMIPGKAETLRRIADFCGLDAEDAKIAATIAAVDGDREATRFNKGVAGRGQTAITDAQKDAVRALTDAYPSIDFTPIGL